MVHRKLRQRKKLEIVEQDFCGFAPLATMSLQQIVFYTTHRPRPLRAEILASPMIHLSTQRCSLEDYALRPFVHEEEELPAPTPSKFLVAATQPSSLVVVHKC